MASVHWEVPGRCSGPDWRYAMLGSGTNQMVVSWRGTAYKMVAYRKTGSSEKNRPVLCHICIQSVRNHVWGWPVRSFHLTWKTVKPPKTSAYLVVTAPLQHQFNCGFSVHVIRHSQDTVVAKSVQFIPVYVCTCVWGVSEKHWVFHTPYTYPTRKHTVIRPKTLSSYERTCNHAVNISYPMADSTTVSFSPTTKLASSSPFSEFRKQAKHSSPTADILFLSCETRHWKVPQELPKRDTSQTAWWPDQNGRRQSSRYGWWIHLFCESERSIPVGIH